MPSYRTQVDVTAPPETVWPLVADLTRHPEWAADDVEIERDGAAGAGTDAAADDRYVSTATAKGRQFRADLRVVDVQPPRRFAFTATDGTGEWRHEFELVPAAGGTRVTRTMTGKLTPAQAALFWLVLLPVKKPSAKASLQRLKERAEQA